MSPSTEEPKNGRPSRNVKEDVNNCRRNFQNIQALVIAVQFASDEEAAEFAGFVVSDACAGVLRLMRLLMDDLDKLEAAL